jgi:hypothetical protein
MLVVLQMMQDHCARLGGNDMKILWSKLDACIDHILAVLEDMEK